jgi:hypothetical protein
LNIDVCTLYIYENKENPQKKEKKRRRNLVNDNGRGKEAKPKKKKKKMLPPLVALIQADTGQRSSIHAYFLCKAPTASSYHRVDTNTNQYLKEESSRYRKYPPLSMR